MEHWVFPRSKEISDVRSLFFPLKELMTEGLQKDYSRSSALNQSGMSSFWAQESRKADIRQKVFLDKDSNCRSQRFPRGR